MIRFGVILALISGVAFWLGRNWGEAQVARTPALSQDHAPSETEKVTSWIQSPPAPGSEVDRDRRAFLVNLGRDPERGLETVKNMAGEFLAQGRESEARHVLQWVRHTREAPDSYRYLAEQARRAMARDAAGVEAGILTAMSLVELLDDLGYRAEDRRQLLVDLVSRAKNAEDRRLLALRLGRAVASE